MLAFLERMQAAAQASGERLAMHTNLPQTWKVDGPSFLNSTNFETLLLANTDFETAFARQYEIKISKVPRLDP